MSLIPYKGLQVVSPTSAPGGAALTADFEAMADRIGVCNYTATADPTASADSSAGYSVGSRWMNQTSRTEFVCLDATTGAAVWAGNYLQGARVGQSIAFTDTSTSGTVRGFSILPTYNQSASATANTDLFINRIEYPVGSGTQLFCDFQVGGVSKFNISDTGFVTASRIALTQSLTTGVSSPSLVSGAVTPDCTAGNTANVPTLSSNTTVANPTGTPVDAQQLSLRISQNGTGGWSITWGSQYAFGSDITTSMIPTTANARFEIGFKWYAASSTWRAVALARGF